MEKRCFSLKTKEFNDCLKSYYHYKDPNEIKPNDKDKSTPENKNTDKAEKNRQKMNKLFSVMKDVEELENDPNYKVSQPIKGKTLSSQNNKEIYSLEIGHDRAMAVIVEQDKKKVYVWFWVGSHEEYSTKLNNGDLKKSSSNIKTKNEVIIKEKIQELKKDSPSPHAKNYMGNIEKMRQGYAPQDNKKSKKDKKYR